MKDAARPSEWASSWLNCIMGRSTASEVSALTLRPADVFSVRSSASRASVVHPFKQTRRLFLAISFVVFYALSSHMYPVH